jgi:hypothetical protein
MPWAWAIRNCRQVGPLRRGAGSMPARFEDQPHRAGCKLVAEPGEFALEPPVAPSRVLRGQSQHQLAQLRCRGPATGAAASGLGPSSGHQVSAPPQDRLWGNDPMQAASRGQPSGQRREHRPVSPGQARSAHLATSHRDLVAEHQNLRILRRGASGQQPSQATSCRKIRYSSRAATAGDHARRPPSSNTACQLRG